MNPFGWISIAIFALAAAIHTLTALLDGKLMKILEYVNVALHIAGFFTLLLAKASLELLLLSFTLSFLYYLVFRIIFTRRKEGEQ